MVHAQVQPNLLTPELSQLHNFTCVTEGEACRLVLKATCTSSDLDPIPTSLVKNCIDILATPIVAYHFLKDPSLHISSVVLFHLSSKKPTLDKDVQNYRSLSNLSFLSNVENCGKLIKFTHQ